MKYTSFEYHCANCGNTEDLEIEVESPSDYYMLDDACPNCGAPLPDNIGAEAEKAVTNHFAGIADYLHDLQRDG